MEFSSPNDGVEGARAAYADGTVGGFVLEQARLWSQAMTLRAVDVTRELLQALLDHFWEARRKRVAREAKLFPGGYLISYSSLIARAGVAVEARRLGGPLAEISALCELKGWPPLAALVVRQDVGQPGVGYFRRPGSAKVDLVTEEHLRGWEADARACIGFERMPKLAAPITAKARGSARRAKEPS